MPENNKQQINKPSVRSADGQSQEKYPLDNYTAKPESNEKESSPYYKSNAPSICLPKGGGALKGIDEKFKVNPVNGTTSLEVPLPITPGRSGFTPSLSLQYNSGSGNSEFGIGWNIALPSIQRKTDKQLPLYDDKLHSDVFLLAGAEDLVPVTALNGDIVTDTTTLSGYSITKYIPRIEGLFANIEHITNSNTGESWWRVTSKDNIVTYYGLTLDGRMSNPEDSTRIFKWLPQLICDHKGNVQEYTYISEDLAGVPQEVHEANRSSVINKYLKSVKYCNRIPYSFPDENTNTVLDAIEVYKPTMPSSVDYLMELVLDYGDHDTNYPTPTRDISDWGCRKDPFSDCHAGFEIRTYRLCQRVMMFHYFAELNSNVYGPTLVRSLDLDYEYYDDSNIPYAEADFITSITQSSYKRSGSSTYNKRSLPPFTVSYQQLEWSTEVKSVSTSDVQNAPQGLTGAYQWIDVWGEGLPGILTEQGSGWYYKRNLGESNFTSAVEIAPKPSLKGLGSTLQWQDLDADGRRQVVSRQSKQSGYYELDDNDKWQPFTTFKNNPNVNWESPYSKMLDLDGDGRPDLLITEDRVWTWYKNNGKKGFDIAGTISTFTDQEKGPKLLLNDEMQSVFLADMSGDGMTDIVRVTNDEVCYWPNLGYGKFGARVSMTNAPFFDTPDIFDPMRVTLTDVSGTGATDIIYLGYNKCKVWINLSGNAWSDVKEISLFPTTEQFSKIAVLDFLGNGTGCIVWSSPLPQHQSTPMRYIDLMGGKKPLLMTSYSNGMGKTTTFTYKSSTKFYLDDNKTGTPWATKLPFPVHCIETVIVADSTSETSYTQSYTYHHGYYDHEEREFRGFGRVDVKDTDTAAFYENSGTVEENDLDQYPVLTKTWYHTGAWLREQSLLLSFETEYYTHANWKDAPAHIKLPSGMNAKEEREAYRSIKGLPLRQEVYALDKGAFEEIPFVATSYAYCTEVKQSLYHNRHASFYSYQHQSVAWQCERLPADPRVAHEITLEVDLYGNVLQSASVVYPRLSGQVPGGTPGVVSGLQTNSALISYSVAAYTNDVIGTVAPFHYRLRLPKETKTYELHNLDDTTDLWLPESLKNEFENEASEIAFTSSYSSGKKKRLLSHARTLYRGNDTTTVLAYGVLESHALGHESYQLAYTTGSGSILDGTPVTPSMLTNAKYLNENTIFGGRGSTNYWIPSGTIVYMTTPPNNFFMPWKHKDPWGNETIISYYSNYLLLPATIEDAEGNIMTVNDYDWRCLQATKVTDENDNVGEVLFDILCLPVAMALKGKDTGAEGDNLDNVAADLDSTTLNAFWSDPKTEAPGLLGNATWRCVYDFNSQPLSVAMLAREEHYEYVEAEQVSNPSYPDSPVLIRVTYTDGFGRVAMHKVQTTDDPGTSAERWIGSGKTVYNNKGNVVLQYEPFYSSTHDYDSAQQAADKSVSPRIFYDALSRVYRTEFPDGTFTKTIWTAWAQTVYDNNDTVTDSEWYTLRHSGALSSNAEEVDAKNKAVIHYNTPTTIHTDLLARPFYTVQMNAWEDGSIQYQPVESYVELDILGNTLAVHDAEGKNTLTYSYNHLKAVVSTLSVDSGQQYILPAVDGQPHLAWDADDREFGFTYDDIRRPLEKTVDDGSTSTTLEVMVYGEGATSDKAHNLRGKLYQLYDGAGLVQVDDYDFKGNPLSSTRTYTDDYDTHPDWTTIGSVAMESTYYTTLTTYDALNRPVAITTPDTGVTSYTYDATGQLFTVRVIGVHGLTSTLVKGIFYNEKGQRTKIQQSEGDTIVTQLTTTTYTYDPKTYRVTQIRTVRTSNTSQALQELNYWYDPVGNITKQTDGADQELYYNVMGSTINVASPDNSYTYDALYRLIEAGGREQGQTSDSTKYPTTDDDSYWFAGLMHKHDDDKMRRYKQYYTYDKAGNMITMQHTVTGGSAGWTRDMDYVDTGSNMLLQSDTEGAAEMYSYDTRGNMVAGMSHIADMEYNHVNKLQHVELQDGRHIYYQYNGSGQRVRKVVIDAASNLKHVRKYLGPWEVYEKYNTSTSTLAEQRETLHVQDDTARIVQIDTDTLASTPTPLVRYQYSNHLGTSSLVLDDTAAIITYEEYFPFGSTSFQSGTSAAEISLKRYRYIGKERDEETGFYYMDARYYAPWLARWCAVDPLEAQLAPMSPYCYSNNNPIMFIDPEGTKAKTGTPQANQSQADAADDGGGGKKNTSKNQTNTTEHVSNNTNLNVWQGSENKDSGVELSPDIKKKTENNKRLTLYIYADYGTNNGEIATGDLSKDDVKKIAAEISNTYKQNGLTVDVIPIYDEAEGKTLYNMWKHGELPLNQGVLELVSYKPSSISGTQRGGSTSPWFWYGKNGSESAQMQVNVYDIIWNSKNAISKPLDSNANYIGLAAAHEFLHYLLDAVVYNFFGDVEYGNKTDAVFGLHGSHSNTTPANLLNTKIRVTGKVIDSDRKILDEQVKGISIFGLDLISDHRFNTLNKDLLLSQVGKIRTENSR